MAKVTITIIDSEESIDLKASFKPDLDVDNPTEAQSFAMKLLSLAPKINTGVLNEFLED